MNPSARDDRTWTLYCNHESDGTWCFDAHGAPIPEGELVQVMPVAAHRAALADAEEFANSSEHPNWEAGWDAGHARGLREGLAAARQVDEAMVERMLDAWYAEDWRSYAAEERAERARAALLAALTPSQRRSDDR